MTARRRHQWQEAVMSRTQQILLGLLILQGMIAAILFWPETTPAGSTAPLLGELDIAAVTALRIADDLGNETTLEKRDDGWVAADAGDFPVNAGAPEALLAKLTALRGERLVAETSSSHARLGVASGAFQRRVTLSFAAGSAQTVYLGSAPGTRAVHVRLENEDHVYLTNGIDLSTAAATIASWVDTEYVPLAPGSLQAVTLQNESGEIAFQRGETGDWELAELAAGEVANGQTVRDLVARLPGLRFVRPVGTAVDPAYGLAAPAAVVTMTTADGDVELRIGAQAENGEYYAAYSDSPYIVLLANSSVDNLVNWTRAEFLESSAGE
jgi:hypothetical protein